MNPHAELIKRLREMATDHSNRLSDMDAANDAADALEAVQTGAPVQPAATGERGEPVAWRRWDADGGRIVTQSKRVAEIWADQSAAAEPLYTHPAPLVPMTDWDIDHILFSLPSDRISVKAHREFARAIEAHHGVKAWLTQ